MKIKTTFCISVSREYHSWYFQFLPVIAITRQDVFADEAAYYFVVHWLVFQMNIRFTRPKQMNPRAKR